MNFLIRAVQFIFFGLICFCVAGCHESGTWADDKKNWERIFKAPKPDNVTVVRSQFWRSPHFTYEFEYFIHIAANDDFKNLLFSNNKLKQLNVTGNSEALHFFGGKPIWFIPKSVESYEVWIYADDPHSTFKIFVDRETHDLFLTDQQI